LHAEGKRTNKIDRDMEETIGGSRQTTVSGGDSLSAGSRTVQASTITLEATQELTLKCGAGTIKIDAAGMITINGTLVQIN
jgi:type VI secretion system secreted protein VgrG